jgi:hypothetical protein
MPVQNGCQAELEGVTFIGTSEIGLARDAPAISMVLYHKALVASDKAHVTIKGNL